MVPVIPLSATVAIKTGSLASHRETYPNASASTAAGIIHGVSGTTIRFAGKPIVVARWK
jgi:hypothetical protein